MTVRAEATQVVEVAPLILLNVLLSGDDCHWMFPVFPLRVSVVLFVPEHTVVPPETVPPTDDGMTVMVAVVLVVGEQTPLVTTAK